jgi:hypothetical protein
MYSVLCWAIETGPIERFYKSSMKVGFLARSVSPLLTHFYAGLHHSSGRDEDAVLPASPNV